MFRPFAMGAIFWLLIISQSTLASVQCIDLFRVRQPIVASEFRDISHRQQFLSMSPSKIEREGLTNQELPYGSLDVDFDGSAVRDYTDTGARDLYSALIRKPYPSRSESSRIRDLETELMILPAFSGETWSGALMFKDYFRSAYKLGEVSTFKYFFSTSKSYATAEGFSRNGIHSKPSETHVRVIYRVLGSSGKDVSGHSYYSNAEKEVLFTAFSQFRVEAIEQVSKTDSPHDLFIVTMKEVAPIIPSLPTGKPRKSEPDVEIQRIFTSGEVAKAKASGQWASLIGSTEAVNWLKTWDWLRSSVGSLEVGPSLLRQIHRKVMNDSFFAGYERRRIRKALHEGKLTEQEAQTALEAVESGVPFTSIFHSELGGRYRDSMDILIDRGEPGVPLTREQLQGAALNPLLRLDEKTLRTYPDGENWSVDIHLVAPKDIDRLVRLAFQKFNGLTAHPMAPRDYIRAVTDLELNLIAIHPFLDGNGRSIRLLRDFLLIKAGLPPPLNAFEFDFYTPLEVQVRDRIVGMQKYLQESRSSAMRRHQSH